MKYLNPYNIEPLAFMSKFIIPDTTERRRRINRSDIIVHSHKTSKQGQKEFDFPDGFKCFALNQKNADRKHNKWLKSK